jgi:hypothetical protein
VKVEDKEAITMRNIKAILAGALIAPALALTGGLAYASTTSGNSPAPARPAATATAQAHSQHITGQARHNSCGWWHGDRCDQRGYGYQRQPAHQQPVHQRHGYRHHSSRYQGNSGYGYGGYQGNWAYQGNWGSGQRGSGSRWGGSGCCRHGW